MWLEGEVGDFQPIERRRRKLVGSMEPMRLPECRESDLSHRTPLIMHAPLLGEKYTRFHCRNALQQFVRGKGGRAMLVLPFVWR
jgi:hypothetical protein